MKYLFIHKIDTRVCDFWSYHTVLIMIKGILVIGYCVRLSSRSVS